MNVQPNFDALVLCGQHLAALHQLPEAPEQKMRAKLQEILIGRDNFEACREGILTREELRNVLLAHMMTLIARCAGVDEPSYREDADIIREVEMALFGDGRN